MDSHETNKIAGAVLGTCLLAFGLNIVSKGVFSHNALAKPGYDLPAGAEAAKEGAGKAEGPVEPLPVLLAKADIKKGEANAKPCLACHAFEKGAAAKVGPPLYGIVGRATGSIAGFSYSEGLKAKGGNWTLEALNTFIANPKAYVTGTKMSYAGLPDAAKRADVLDYLNSLADNPAPLPAPLPK